MEQNRRAALTHFVPGEIDAIRRRPELGASFDHTNRLAVPLLASFCNVCRCVESRSICFEGGTDASPCPHHRCLFRSVTQRTLRGLPIPTRKLAFAPALTSSFWSNESDQYEEIIVNPTLLKLVTQRGNVDCGGVQYDVVRYGLCSAFILPVAHGHATVSFELDSKLDTEIPAIIPVINGIVEAAS